MPTAAPYPYAFNPRSELVPLVPPATRSLLDIGSGRGGFGAGLRAHLPGARLVGIEPDADAAESASEFFDDVLVGSFPGLAIDERFDAITFVDVLEHMADPWSALTAAAMLLGEDGVVISSIPNVRYWFVVADLAFRGNWNYRDSGILDRTHLRFFTRSSIESMYSDCGFDICQMVGINSYRPSSAVRRLGMCVAGDLRFMQFATVARPKRSTASAPRRSP